MEWRYALAWPMIWVTPIALVSQVAFKVINHYGDEVMQVYETGGGE